MAKLKEYASLASTPHIYVAASPHILKYDISGVRVPFSLVTRFHWYLSDPILDQARNT